MADEENKSRIVTIVAAAAALLAGLAAATGHLTALVNTVQSYIYPDLAELKVRDIRVEEVLQDAGATKNDFVALQVESVVDKKGGAAKNCFGMLLLDGMTIKSTRLHAAPASYDFDAGPAQRKLRYHFYIIKDDATTKSRLRLECDGLVTPWIEIETLPFKPL